MINRIAKQIKSRRCLGVMLFIVGIVAGVIAFLLFIETNRAADELKKDQSQNVTACAYIVDNTLNDVISDLDYFRTSPDLFRFISYPDHANYSVLAQLFSSFVEKKKYLQLRYISPQGQEMLRVDYIEPRTQVISRLQNKQHRDYFKKTMRLSPGQIHYSPVDLNQEYGAVVRPHQPVLRMATPVYDANNTLWGMLIINLDADQLIAQLQQTCADNNRILLFDHQGSIIYDSTRTLDDGIAQNLAPSMQQLFPDAWPMMRQNNAQFFSDRWLWSWHAIDLENLEPDRGRLLLASLLPEERFTAPYSGDYIAIVSLGAILLGLWVYIMACLRAGILKRIPKS